MKNTNNTFKLILNLTNINNYFNVTALKEIL